MHKHKLVVYNESLGRCSCGYVVQLARWPTRVHPGDSQFHLAGKWHAPSLKEARQFSVYDVLWYNHPPQSYDEALALLGEYQIEPYWDRKRSRTVFRMRRGVVRAFADIVAKDDLWKILADLLRLDSPEQVRAFRNILKSL